MPKSHFPLPVKAVMIDLDGTLLDTVTDLAVAVNLMLGKLGCAPLDQAQVRTFVGKGIPHLVKRSLAGALSGETEGALFERALPLYLDCYASVNGKHTTLYPGVREGLDALQSAGFPLACVTNKSERFTLPLLAQMRLADYFSIVIAGDTLPRKKPDPLPLTHTCRHFGIAPREMLMIGDSGNDSRSAQAAGSPVVLMTYGYSEGENVADLRANAIVSTFTVIPALLDS